MERSALHVENSAGSGNQKSDRNSSLGRGLRSWLGLVVVPFIFDAYITKKIPWTWWRKSKNRHVVTVMGWVDAMKGMPTIIKKQGSEISTCFQVI